MCSVRCPIRVEVENDQVLWIEGNKHVPDMGTALCPRGAAGRSLLTDDQRLTQPLIRTGPRGSGQFRPASWEEALDFTAGKLKAVVDEHGGRSVVLAERAQLSTHASKAFLKALGSPNYVSHDALCKGSVNTACRSLFGYTDAQMGMDMKNARQIILYGRNLFESISVKEVRQVFQALSKGAKLTYIDPRATVTATKADRYWQIRPGTDLALNYALINVILSEQLYHREFVGRWVEGLEELAEFVGPYTPQWAQKETGVAAAEIVNLAREVSRDKPAVIFNFGYRGAHHTNEVYFRRSIMILNTLMGAVEAKGGFFFKKGPGEVGGKPARKLTEQEFSKVDEVRFDGVGTREFPLPDPNHGAAQMLARAVLEEKPYPIKALIAFRFDPVASIPDAGRTIKALEKLDLVVSIDINHSDIAAYSDVILPESCFLERTDSIQQVNGLKPQMFLRRRAAAPRYDTREGPMIIKGLAERMGLGDYFQYDSVEDLVRWQLAPTGFSLEDFEAKGFVAYAPDPIFWDRQDGLKLKTPSGRIEFKSSLLEDAGYESFPAYQSPESPPEGSFRLTVGRAAAHTHVSTQNNLYLNELIPENVLWIHPDPAARLGVSDGEYVQVSSSRNGGRIRAKVTELIHPEAVFMIHGFGRINPRASRSHQKGVSDAALMENVSDEVGGSPALHHTFVTVRAA
jgi:thiosulfate reductase/polysulfide reductase chain A